MLRVNWGKMVDWGKDNQLPFGNGPFSAELRSPQVYFLDVRSVRLVVNLCAALLTGIIAHFQIGNLFLSILVSGQTLINKGLKYATTQ